MSQGNEASQKGWRPFREAHAIEAVATVANFAAPLNDTMLRRALRIADKLAASSDLPIREPISEVMINFKPGAGPQLLENTPVTGIVFKRNEIDKDPTGLPLTVPVEELVVHAQNVVFQSRRYTRWSEYKNRCFELLTPVLDALLSGASVAQLRLEYRDRFTFMGKAEEASAKGLLQPGSDYLAPHIFNQTRLWHSHTGMFLDAIGVQNRLVQINIDANDFQSAERAVRSVSIMTGVQDNFAPPTLEAEDQTAPQLLGRLDDLHELSNGVFKSLITKEIAAEIGLN